MGVDYELFWQLTPRKLEPFVEAYKQKTELETETFREKTNFAAWLQGIYFARAIAANFSKNTKYFDEPISLQAQDDGGVAKAVKFEAWAMEFNRGLARREICSEL